jgi:hypothetical protein
MVLLPFQPLVQGVFTRHAAICQPKSHEVDFFGALLHSFSHPEAQPERK